MGDRRALLRVGLTSYLTAYPPRVALLSGRIIPAPSKKSRQSSANMLFCYARVYTRPHVYAPFPNPLNLIDGPTLERATTAGLL